jgi:hypothetical protein
MPLQSEASKTITPVPTKYAVLDEVQETMATSVIGANVDQVLYDLEHVYDWSYDDMLELLDNWYDAEEQRLYNATSLEKKLEIQGQLKDIEFATKRLEAMISCQEAHAEAIKYMKDAVNQAFAVSGTYIPCPSLTPPPLQRQTGDMGYIPTGDDPFDVDSLAGEGDEEEPEAEATDYTLPPPTVEEYDPVWERF